MYKDVIIKNLYGSNVYLVNRKVKLSYQVVMIYIIIVRDTP